VKAHRRTEITVETDQVVVIRRARFLRGWCPECGSEVDRVCLPDAHAVVGMSGKARGASTVAQGWHVSVGQDGAVLVCLESLLKSM
jgi:hypothetical protein